MRCSLKMLRRGPYHGPTYDAEEAWKSGGVAGLFTMDDKGVFDGILRNWLLLRLWE